MKSSSSWATLGFNAWMLGMEASSVIGLRTLKIAAGGDAAQREADLMVSEKVEAVSDLYWQAVTGQLGQTPTTAIRKTVATYRRKVRANQRRLTR